jgi:dipeptidyl-peptidase 4
MSNRTRAALLFGWAWAVAGVVSSCEGPGSQPQASRAAESAAAPSPAPRPEAVLAAAVLPAAPAPARADDRVLEQIASTLNFSLGKPAGVWVAPDGREVLFRRSEARSFVSDLYAFDVASGRERQLLGAQTLLGGAEEHLTAQERARRERMRLVTRGITSFSASRDGTRLLVPLSGQMFIYERGSAKARALPAPGSVIDPTLSPDGACVAFVVDSDLYVARVSGDAPAQKLSRRASDAIENGVAEFVAQEEMDRQHGYWWSPDSTRLAYQRSDLSHVEALHIADATHPEQPAASFRYPRVGTPNAEVSLGVIGVAGGATTWVDWDRAEYPYLAAVSWQPNAPLTLLVQNRAQTAEKLLAADPKSGRTRELLSESDAAWLNLDSSELMPRFTPDGSAFLWSTERNGGWELELRSASGALVRTLVPKELGYRALAGLDERRMSAWVVASADPRQRHVYRVPLDGSAPVPLTQGESSSDVRVNDATGVHVLVTRDRNGTTRQLVRGPDDVVAGELASVAESPAAPPRPELIDVSIEGRQHYAAVLRPRSFQPGHRYPVLLSVYGGPHANMVSLDPNAYLLDQWYADGGFIVVRADGRGTPGRGRDWERAIEKDLIGVALADQIAILRAVASERPELDLDRVGVTGWSFGGYFSVMAVLLRPDVFRAAVAGAPVTDWRNYDTHYTERYLGLLSDDAAPYDASSALTHASQLSRPLLIVHGTTDDNVYFKHSLDLAQALFRADRPFELLPLAGFTHLVPDPVVRKALSHRVFDFFRAELGG